nr:helicase-related protein [Actinomyces ruminis]
MNPDLLRAVRDARRAAAGEDRQGGYERRDGRRAGSGRGGRWSRHAGGRPRPPRRGEGGARTARLRPPARGTVIGALQRADLLPAIVFVFSRAGCESAVREAISRGVDLTTPDEARRIREIIDRRTADIPTADLGVLGFHAWAHALSRGVAAHHAGLLPVFKETVEELFAANLVKVVYATETLALGINMPARTVVLESLRKWNGSAHVTLTPGEYTQLTGRAGRRGIDVEGHAVVLATDDAEPAFVASLASRRTYRWYRPSVPPTTWPSICWSACRVNAPGRCWSPPSPSSRPTGAWWNWPPKSAASAGTWTRWSSRWPATWVTSASTPCCAVASPMPRPISPAQTGPHAAARRAAPWGRWRAVTWSCIAPAGATGTASSSPNMPRAPGSRT